MDSSGGTSQATAQESKEERVARITAKQTIAVTMITVLGALGGAAIQHLASQSNATASATNAVAPAIQYWLEIEGIELANMPVGESPRRIRLVATVDSVKYSYPSSVIWEPVQGDMPDESFPLPVDSLPHRLSFVMFLDDAPNEPLTFHSNESVDISNIPHSGETKLVGFTPGSRTTGPQEIQVRVKFNFRTK